MDYRIGTMRTEEIARKWLALAERRLDHLEELHRSGRWEKYFSEQSLLKLKKATEQTAKEWAALLPPVMNAPEATVTPTQEAHALPHDPEAEPGDEHRDAIGDALSDGAVHDAGHDASDGAVHDAVESGPEARLDPVAV